MLVLIFGCLRSNWAEELVSLCYIANVFFMYVLQVCMHGHCMHPCTIWFYHLNPFYWLIFFIWYQDLFGFFVANVYLMPAHCNEDWWLHICYWSKFMTCHLMIFEVEDLNCWYVLFMCILFGHVLYEWVGTCLCSFPWYLRCYNLFNYIDFPYYYWLHIRFEKYFFLW